MSISYFKNQLIANLADSTKINYKAYYHDAIMFDSSVTPSQGIGIEDFNFNFNFKNYDSATQTVPNDPSANWQQDLVLQGTPVVDTDHITVTNSNAYAQFPFNSTSENIFNRSSSMGYAMTIIFKIGSTNDTSANDLISNRGYCANSNSGGYDWMVRPQTNTCFLHDSGGQKCGISYPTRPNIIVMTVNSSAYLTNKSITDNTSSSGSISLSNLSGRICFFGSNYSNQATNYINEQFTGVCYWMFQANRMLTDDEITQVINYNENL